MKVTRNYYEIQPRRKQQQTFRRKNKIKLEEIETPTVLLLDQASNGGYCLYDSKSRLVMSGIIKRGNTSLPEFKQRFVEYISEIVDEYKADTIFYEEVFDELNMTTTEVLFYLKHAIQDLGYFRDDLSIYGIHHKTWKSKMAKPESFRFNKDDKEEVRKWVKKIYPLIGVTVQDEFDAIGMGIAVMIKGKGKQNFYKQAGFNKRLPVHFTLYENVLEDNVKDIEITNVSEQLDTLEDKQKRKEEEFVKKLRKPFRVAYEEGGLIELELEKNKGVKKLFRQFLSHKDALTFVRIPKDYKYWGVILLEHGESPERFETEESKKNEYLLLCARKKRIK